MIKKRLNTIKIITCGLLLSSVHCNNLNNQVEQLTEVEKILNMDISFNTINKNILNNNNNVSKQKSIENFYHYLMGNNGFNLFLILSYGTPNVLNIINSTIRENPVKDYIRSNGIENKITGTINGIQSQVIETDIYGTFDNTPSSKQQFKNTYFQLVNNTFPNYFTENNNFNKAVGEFRRANRNMYGHNNEVNNIINTMSTYFKERDSTINKQKTLALNSWENIFNRTMKYQEEQKNKKE